MTCSEQLAGWAAQLAFSDIPDPVIEDQKTRVLDILGVTLAASAMPRSEPVRRAALRLGSGDESRIIGFGDRTSAASAAVANGALAHALDYDDTHNESVVHISAPVISTGLTLGEALRSDGQTVLAAMVAGAEAGVRIGSAAPGGFHRRGFHATGVVGALAATIVAGKLLGLDAGRLRHAIGTAVSQASGVMECFRDGSETKQLHPGWAAHSGIAAAYLAEAGFTGPATALEGRNGFYQAHADTNPPDYTKIHMDLGREWSCLATSYKPYPCGHVVHAFLDALLMLYREEGLRAEQVESIACPIAEWMIPVMCEPREVKLRPQSEYHAKFSFPFTMAAALTFGRLGVEAFSEANIRDTEILELAEKIHHEVDHGAPGTGRFKGWVKVTTTDGRHLERIVEDNWGSPANPMTPDQVRRKFEENAALALPDARVEQIIGLAGEMDCLTDVARLIDLCIRP